jgi:uncharacterized membrane protein
MEGLDESITFWIHAVGTAIEVFGVLVILIGILWASLKFWQAGRQMESFPGRYRDYKIRLGQSLLLGLEILVAADIVRTVALEPNFTNLGVLGLLVLIRTFLSWTLVLEIEGRWPWQPERAAVEKNESM